MARRMKDARRFCLRCRKISNSCPCISIFDGLFTERNSDLNDSVELGEVESEPVYEEDHRSFPIHFNDLDCVAPDCKKSDQHHEFIPVYDFSIDHLPKTLKHPLFYGWLQNCIPFVVRVTGKRKATGRACLITQDMNEIKQCPHLDCPLRKTLGPKHNVYGGVGIITNKHVVQTDDEAKKTIVEFFYHNDDDRHMTVIKERGYSLRIPNKKMDYSVFSCYTHKKFLPVVIEKLDKIRDCVWLCIPRQIRDDSKNYAIIISHPHGTLKKISIGRVVERRKRIMSDTEKENVMILRNLYNICDKKDTINDRNNALERFEVYMCQLPDLELSFTKTLYTTATCRGSSGAPVYMGNVVKGEFGQDINQAHTHVGVDNQTGYNNCYT